MIFRSRTDRNTDIQIEDFSDFKHCLNVSKTTKNVYELRLFLKLSNKLEKILLSERILCMESIVIVKNFDFEILTYLYVFGSPEFIYAIFTAMYICMCVRE